MPPYRTRDVSPPPQAPRDRGIVGELIEQFADRYAFLRELVQNAIDADTEEVAVELSYSPSTQIASISIVDQGCGMSRELIEERLLVLFRSTKEDDATKIGKFGIGFVSVLAVDPTIVRVASTKAGVRHVLHLFPDLSYELFEAGRSNRSGTTVTVEVACEDGDFPELVLECERAVSAWCRHALTPIVFHASSPSVEIGPKRIDCPLSLDDAIVSVTGSSKDGHLQAVVGIARDGQPYAGFFNHGLTLYETNEPLLGNLAFKIQDSRLGHTLSRDNVRRDAAFDQAVDFVSRLADRQLREAVTQKVAAAAQGNVDEYVQIASTVKQSGKSPLEWTLPILEPVDGRLTITDDQLADKGGWVHHDAGPVTQFLASEGAFVLPLAAEKFAAELGFKLRQAWRSVLVQPLSPSPKEAALIGRVAEILGDIYREPRDVVIAAFSGHQGDFCVSLPRFGPQVISWHNAATSPFKLLRRRVVAIRKDAPMFCDALALSDREHAALLVTRAILLRFDVLTPSRSEAIFEKALGAFE